MQLPSSLRRLILCYRVGIVWSGKVCKPNVFSCLKLIHEEVDTEAAHVTSRLKNKDHEVSICKGPGSLAEQLHSDGTCGKAEIHGWFLEHPRLSFINIQALTT